MSAVNNYEKAYLPSRITAVRIANGYLQERIYHGSNQRIIFEHGIHVFNVAKIAENIARQTGKLNPDIAYVLGLLHDIGRIKDETVTKVPHSIEGYNYLRKIGFPDAAPICITHNFIDPDIKAEDFPTYDEKSFAFARGFLKKVRYNDYDRLIQLADLFSRGKEFSASASDWTRTNSSITSKTCLTKTRRLTCAIILTANIILMWNRLLPTRLICTNTRTNPMTVPSFLFCRRHRTSSTPANAQLFKQRILTEIIFGNLGRFRRSDMKPFALMQIISQTVSFF